MKLIPCHVQNVRALVELPHSEVIEKSCVTVAIVVSQIVVSQIAGGQYGRARCRKSEPKERTCVNIDTFLADF